MSRILCIHFRSSNSEDYQKDYKAEKRENALLYQRLCKPYWLRQGGNNADNYQCNHYEGKQNYRKNGRENNPVNSKLISNAELSQNG